MSWIERFKQRYGIVKVKKSGESAGFDQEIARTRKEGKLSEILTTYEPANIYNADETGLFWKMLPDNSLGFVGKNQHGSKEQKAKVTLLIEQIWTDLISCLCWSSEKVQSRVPSRTTRFQ